MHRALGTRYVSVPLEVSIEHVQTSSTVVGKGFFQLMLPLPYHIYHRSGPNPFLYGHKSNATYVFLQQLLFKMSFVGQHSAP
jgi:hypothetical protein